MKRIVLQHASGLTQILGVGPVDDKGNDEQPQTFIPVTEGVECDGKVQPLNLVASRRSYWLYKPLMLPMRAKDFNPRQR